MNELFHQNLGDALRYRAEVSPTACAISFPQTGEQLSYRSWRDESIRIASGLLELGIDQGERIALLAENRIQWPIIEFACALAGAIFVPLNTHLRRKELEYILGHSQVKAIFLSNRFRSQSYLSTITSLLPQLPKLKYLITLDKPKGECIDYRSLKGPEKSITPQGGDVCALLYTSGTTGFPKGALLSHRAMLFDGSQVSLRLQINSKDRWTSMIPLFHCAGCVMNILGCVLTGARYVGIDAFDPVSMFQIIQAEHCTVLSGVPTSYAAMLNHPDRKHYDLNSLRTGTCGGADANPQLLARCATEYPIPHLCNVYGQTESATIISCPTTNDPERWSTVGKPLDGCKIQITDPTTHQPVTQGCIGQIEAKGPFVMNGYLNNLEATKDTIDEDGWLKTGDLGQITKSGNLQLTGGRLRDMIIRGGENIYPVEVENCLLDHASVEETAVFGLPDDYYGEIVAAAVILRGITGAGSLINHCRERLARFKVPTMWFDVKEFPLTASGKIKKITLQTLATKGDLKILHNSIANKAPGF